MDDTNLKDKSILITGATSGIGRQTAVTLAGLGVFVIGVGRSGQRCERAEQEIRARYPQASVQYLVADLSVQAQVRHLAEAVENLLRQKGRDRLDVLVNNAGTYAGRHVQTVDCVEFTFAVNHLAPFLLTHELLPLLQAAPGGRVITVSSDSHFGTFLNYPRLAHPLVYNGLWAYKVSKLSNILFTREFNRRHRGNCLHAFAVDPGLVNTEIGLKNTDWFSRAVWASRRKKGVDPGVPVETIVFLAGEPGVESSQANYWHDCRPKEPSRAAQSDRSAARLWDLSCRLCGLINEREE
jgi:NAD(P)-dependent dehydrogenase (short-subunit alcohol dehydrogenase family)